MFKNLLYIINSLNKKDINTNTKKYEEQQNKIKIKNSTYFLLGILTGIIIKDYSILIYILGLTSGIIITKYEINTKELEKLLNKIK